MRPDLGYPSLAAKSEDSCRSAATAVCRVSAELELAGVEPAWRELERSAAASAYQTFAFALAWFETEGIAADVTPFIVTAYDADDRLIALLPLGLARKGHFRVARFAGGRHANYNLGLFRPGIGWTPDDIHGLLSAAARACSARIDLYAFTNQPATWQGDANPLGCLKGQPSPSFGHSTALMLDPDAFFKSHQSARSRKNLRNKASRLAELGPTRCTTAQSASDVATVLAIHLQQKAEKLAALGATDATDPAMAQAFLTRLTEVEGDDGPLLMLHALMSGERIVATFGGLSHHRRFSGLLISYDADPDVARNSPGELLLAAVVADKCREGFTSFDLGVGEARYKETYCPMVEPLFDSFLPITVAGRLFMAGEAIRLKAKRAVKQSPWAWSLAGQARRVMRRCGQARRRN